MNQTPAVPSLPIDLRGERILAAALVEFGHAGFAAARMSDIAREAGVSLTTLSLYFRSKEDLFREVVRSAVMVTLREADAAEPGGEPTTGSRERLKGFANRFWRSMERPEQEALLRLSMSELHGFPELAILHTTEVIERALTRIERILRDGIRDEQLRIRDVRAAARVILSAIIVNALWLSAPDVYGGLTGPDRAHAESAVLDALGGVLGAPTC